MGKVIEKEVEKTMNWQDGDCTTAGAYSLPSLPMRFAFGWSTTSALPEAAQLKEVLDDKSFSFKLAYVMATFALNPTDTRKILRVDRKTIYNWLESEDAELEATVKEHSRRRLNLLYRLAKRWRSLFRWKLPDELKKQPYADGRNIIEEFSAEDLETRISEMEDDLETLCDLAIRQEAEKSDIGADARRLRATGQSLADKPLGNDPYKG